MGQGRPGANAGDRLIRRLSIITLAWRNESFAAGFARTVAEACTAAPDAAVEIIVVANGPDGQAAAEIVRRHLPAARVLALPTNLGFAGGSNAGVAASTGDPVVILNLDVEVPPDFVATIDARLSGDWDVLVPDVLQGPRGAPAGVSTRRRIHRLRFVDPPAGPTTVSGGNGSCLILRRAVVERRSASHGALFDAEFHSYNEDIELFWWLERAGLRCWYDPAVQVRHHLAGSFAGAHQFEARPEAVRVQVMSNYRLTVWMHATSPLDWLGAVGGELTYLGQAVRSSGISGIGSYGQSWRLTLRQARRIRRRRGRLRPGVVDRGPSTDHP